MFGEIALRSLGLCFGLLPRRWQMRLGNGLGLMILKLNFRRSVARENLARAFPNDLAQQARVLKESYENFGNLLLEFLLLFGPLEKWVQRFVDFEGAEHIYSSQARGKGTLFLSSHLGNWEIMAVAGCLKADARLLLVTKLLRPNWLHQSITRARLRGGVRATYEPRTLRDVLSHLKKNGSVGFVLDQYAGPPVGMRVPFFGVPVSTSTALATLARRTGASVLPVFNFRKPDGRWSVQVRAPLEWITGASPQDELALNTAFYTSVIEEGIRKTPEQWLWFHRRFKGDLSPLRDNEWSTGRVRR